MTRGLVTPVTHTFTPVWFYDENLDSVRVYTEDCSVTEVFVTNNLTLLRRNNDEVHGLLHVGFCIEGARHFCKENNLPFNGKVEIRQIIARMLEVQKESLPAILDIVLPTISEYGVNEIEFPD